MDSLTSATQEGRMGLSLAECYRPGGTPIAKVALIKVFEVPAGKDEEFLAGWEQGKAFMERQPVIFPLPLRAPRFKLLR